MTTVTAAETSARPAIAIAHGLPHLSAAHIVRNTACTKKYTGPFREHGWGLSMPRLYPSSRLVGNHETRERHESDDGKFEDRTMGMRQAFADLVAQTERRFSCLSRIRGIAAPSVGAARESAAKDFPRISKDSHRFRVRDFRGVRHQARGRSRRMQTTKHAKNTKRMTDRKIRDRKIGRGRRLPIR
jgi:hypothetical protein